MSGRRVTASVWAAVVFAVGVPAAFGASGVIEEIVVTARQRAESLQDAPVTITALSSSTIERLALNNLEQLANHVPNLLVSYGSSGGSATVRLRGIGTGSASAGFSSAVGLLIDDLHFERGRWIQEGMFDLEQIEVLKGPQALYFGKNNAAGLMILQTRDPGDVLEASLEAGYETVAEEYLLEGGVSVPVTDTLAFRLAGRYSEQTDGWIENTARPQVGVDPFGFVIPGNKGTEDLPGAKELLGRFTALWRPTDQFTAKLKASVADSEDDSVLSFDQLGECFGPGGAPQLVFGVPSPDDDCKANFRRSLSNIPAGLMAPEPREFGDGQTFTEYDSHRVSLRLDYDFGAASLTSVTGFTHYESELVDNATFAGDAQVPFYENTDWDGFSQELRLQTQFDSPVNFLGGVLWTDNDLFFRNSARIAPLPPDSRNGRLWTWDKIANEDSESYSVYGELVWDITPTLEFAGGARYTHEERDFAFTVPHLHEILIALGVLSDQSLAGKFKDSNTSPQVTLTWRPTDQVTLFGAYREGFKSGGFDASFLLTPGADIDDLKFDSEEADGFEFGIKSSWFDNSLQLNATAYFFDYTNLQVSALDTETTTFRIQNAAEASTDGFEVEAAWAPLERLRVRSSVNYNIAEYQEFLTSCYAGQTIEGGCNRNLNVRSGRFSQQDIGGQELAVAPKWVGTLGFTYDFPLGSTGWGASLSADSRYSGRYETSLTQIPDSAESDFAILDATLQLFSPDEHWEVALIGRNLFDHTVVLGSADRSLTGSGNGLPAGSPGIQRADRVVRLQRPRQLWFQVTYRL